MTDEELKMPKPSGWLTSDNPWYSKEIVLNLVRANLELTRRYEEQKLQEQRLELAIKRAKEVP